MLAIVAIDIFAQYISMLKCSLIPHTLLKGINDRRTSAGGEHERFKQFSLLCFNLRVDVHDRSSFCGSALLCMVVDYLVLCGSFGQQNLRTFEGGALVLARLIH